MTDDEKESNSAYKDLGGYLKVNTYKEAWAIWWEEADKEDKNAILNIPQFDAEIFKGITGIDVNQEDEVDITVDGKTKRISRKSAKLLGLLD